MNRPIGYYVHHHGDGHRQRALAIARAAGNTITLLGTGLADRSEGAAFLDLPDDRLDENFNGIDAAERPSVLHYAPIDHEGIRQRTALVTHWIATARPRLMVIDVSVEIAMLTRLASVPFAYVRLNGRRDDRPHLEAFRAASRLLAPFHEALEQPETPAWIRQKTLYFPNIVLPAPPSPEVSGLVLVVLGAGGGISDGETWADAARAVPDRAWHVIGPCSVPGDCPSNLKVMGWVDNASAMIAQAEVVVGGAGDGVVSSVISYRRPFVCLPEPRPFDEQKAKAIRLHQLGAAIVLEGAPQAHDWPSLLDSAIKRAANWPDGLVDPGGPEQVAAWLRGSLKLSPQPRPFAA